MSTFKIPDPTCIALREALPQVLDDYETILHGAMPTLDLSSWNFGAITHRISVKNDAQLIPNLVSLLSSFLENGDRVELCDYAFKNGAAQFDVRLGNLRPAMEWVRDLRFGIQTHGLPTLTNPQSTYWPPWVWGQWMAMRFLPGRSAFCPAGFNGISA